MEREKALRLQRERLQRELEEKKKKVGGSWTVQLPQSVELGRTFSASGTSGESLNTHTDTDTETHTCTDTVTDINTYTSTQIEADTLHTFTQM